MLQPSRIPRKSTNIKGYRPFGQLQASPVADKRRGPRAYPSPFLRKTRVKPHTSTATNTPETVPNGGSGLTPLRAAVSRNSLSLWCFLGPHILRQHLLVLSLRPGKTVARTRKTNSAARSLLAGEPSVRAPDDGASTSTSRRRAGSASSSRGTRVSELQGMLTNLTDLVTGLTAQQAVILR
ncbi:hypothetical protein AXF42_Ash018763 [Apostasia shenzhenica]|uniref:Uncharacterized protein n=1 Tax=Apostasia shenzhenica TaxID=1088818 RepID=A0A2I0AK70_9ASPA|nr:hypothetical protein AXF42_Ash018763 [Apostasia shenzhenica]